MLRPLLLTAIVLAAAPAASATHGMGSVIQAEYDDMFNDQPSAYFEVLSPTVNDLEEGGRTTYEYTLNRGATYRFFGVCDEDCEDLDLVVYDAQDNRVAADFSSNDRPMVTFTVPNTASSTRYRLAVLMSTCDYAPCQFAIGHLRR